MQKLVTLTFIFLAILTGLLRAENYFSESVEVKGVEPYKNPDDFVGISLDVKLVCPNAAGTRLFDNKALGNLFKTLGIKNLRLIGTSIDDSSVNISRADIDSLFGFARAADIQVIFPFRLKDATAESMQDCAIEAQYIIDHYAANLDSFSLGNEPDSYLVPYENLVKQWSALEQQILAKCPTARFTGPTTSNRKTVSRFGHDFKDHSELRDVTYDDVPLGLVPNSPDEADKKLLTSMFELDQEFNPMTDPLAKDHVRLRVETSVFPQPLPDSADTFASTFLVCNKMGSWSEYNVRGINFEDPVFRVMDDGSIQALPAAYALLLFNLTSHGRPLLAQADSTNAFSGVIHLPILSSFPFVAADDGAYYIGRLNGEYGSPFRRSDELVITWPKTIPIHHMDVCLVKVPNNDIAAKTGLTVGGSEIVPDGTWHGVWALLPPPKDPFKITYIVPAGSGAILRMRP